MYSPDNLPEAYIVFAGFVNQLLNDRFLVSSTHTLNLAIGHFSSARWPRVRET